VVHRNLNLGTVVYKEQKGAKLIALGSAKYIGPLPYEHRIRQFEEQCGNSPAAERSAAEPQASPRREVSSLPPTTRTKGDKLNAEDFLHPDARE
jgi:hypothetical protein